MIVDRHLEAGAAIMGRQASKQAKSVHGHCHGDGAAVVEVVQINAGLHKHTAIGAAAARLADVANLLRQRTAIHTRTLRLQRLRRACDLEEAPGNGSVLNSSAGAGAA